MARTLALLAAAVTAVLGAAAGAASTALPRQTSPTASPPSMPPAFSVSTASLDGTHLDVDGANTKLRVRSFALGDLNTLAVGCPVQADAGAVAAAACSFYVYNHRCVAECLDGKTCDFKGVGATRNPWGFPPAPAARQQDTPQQRLTAPVPAGSNASSTSTACRRDVSYLNPFLPLPLAQPYSDPYCSSGTAWAVNTTTHAFPFGPVILRYCFDKSNAPVSLEVQDESSGAAERFSFIDYNPSAPAASTFTPPTDCTCS